MIFSTSEILYLIILVIILVIAYCQYKTFLLIKTIACRQASYQEELEGFKERLIDIRSRFLCNECNEEISMGTISNIRTLLYSFQNRCEASMTISDQKHLDEAMHLLSEYNFFDDERAKKGKIALCAELDYFIARFERGKIPTTSNELSSKRVNMKDREI